MIATLLSLLLGAFTWTLLEYVIHRFLGHDPRTRPNPFATEHVRHHAEGDYFAPSWKKALATLAFVAIIGPALWLLPATDLSVAYLAGLLTMYVSYEVLHRRLHTHAGIGRYGRWAREHHFAHHYGDPRFNHGVTSPIWDVVFGTRKNVERIRIPSRFAMPWLTDPVTGGVRDEFSARFVLF
ncbi:MAG: sterol desaturase family protein [Myxococcaceae bacterium]